MNDLGGFLDSAWRILARGVSDSGSAARLPALATVSPQGWPEVRTVALRGADRAQALLSVHTDPTTAKVAALRADPRAELHVWEPGAQMQIRLAVRVVVQVGKAVADIWAQVPEASRGSYGTTPAPGTLIDGPYDYEKPGVQSGFAVLTCRVHRIDLVHLEVPHRRAVYAGEDGWSGCWVAP